MSSQENLFRNLKRSSSKRFNTIVHKDIATGMDYFSIPEESDLFKKLKKEVGHVEMKKESKVLRRIMSQTGLTKEQIKSNETYEKTLVDIRKDIAKSNLESYEALFFNIAKQVMKEKKLQIWDDAVIEGIRTYFKNSIEERIKKYPYKKIFHYDDYIETEICNHTFEEYLLTYKSSIDEVIIWLNIVENTKNNFIKKFMLISKKKRSK